MKSTISTTTHIKRFVSMQDNGAIFTAREVLHCATSNDAVYKCLSRFTNKGLLRRVASGVYMKAYPGPVVVPAPDVVAAVKAKAWGKRIMKTCQDAAVSLKLQEGENSDIVLLTSGCTSSFNTLQGRVHFRRTCPKKMLLGDSKVAVHTKALWYMGKDYCRSDEKLYELFKDIWNNHFERDELITFAAIVPGWLRDRAIKQKHYNPLKWERDKRKPSDRLILTSDYLPGKDLTQSA